MIYKVSTEFISELRRIAGDCEEPLKRQMVESWVSKLRSKREISSQQYQGMMSDLRKLPYELVGKMMRIIEDTPLHYIDMAMKTSPAAQMAMDCLACFDRDCERRKPTDL